MAPGGREAGGRAGPVEAREKREQPTLGRWGEGGRPQPTHDT